MARKVLKRKQVKQEESPAFSFKSLVEELTNIRENKKLLEKRENELKGKIDEYLTENGNKTSQGSYLSVVDINGVKKLAKKEARKRIALNIEKATELFKAKGLWEKVTDEIHERRINEDYVESAVLDGSLTTYELEKITDIKTSYCIVVRNYTDEDEMPVVEQK